MIKEETARAQPAPAGEHVRVAASRQDRLLSYGPFDYTYTANGELETKTNRTTGEAWLFQYDALGNLFTVGLPNGDLIDYLVDGMGRRVGKKKNGVLLKQWIYRDSLKPVAELDGSGNLVSEFVYGSKSNVPDYVQRGGATYRVISDQLGSPRYVVNVANSGDVPFTATYTSFGQVTGTGLDWMPFGFAGGQYEGDTGLVRFGARDCESTIGRWTIKDTLRVADGILNAYAYVDNDPVNKTDSAGNYMDSACEDQIARGCSDGCAGTCGGLLDEACFQSCMLFNKLAEALSPGSICDNEPWHKDCHAEARAAYAQCYDNGGLIGDCQAVQAAYLDACLMAAATGGSVQ